MTNTMQNSIAVTPSVRKDRTAHCLDGAVERQRSDRKAERHYLPMDIFVDHKTMRQHFQGSATRARSAGIHAVAA